MFRHLPALGESLATLVGAIPVAFLETHLNAHNPLSVFNTKTPRERASECPPLSFEPCSDKIVDKQIFYKFTILKKIVSVSNYSECSIS